MRSVWRYFHFEAMIRVVIGSVKFDSRSTKQTQNSGIDINSDGSQEV